MLWHSVRTLVMSQIHIVVTTQNEILKARKEYSMAAFAHVHAIIASVLSLICVVHLEEVEPLRRYVQEVLQSRAENAPHLLPPLSVSIPGLMSLNNKDKKSTKARKQSRCKEFAK